jgi:hypothetical protein
VALLSKPSPSLHSGAAVYDTLFVELSVQRRLPLVTSIGTFSESSSASHTGLALFARIEAQYQFTRQLSRLRDFPYAASACTLGDSIDGLRPCAARQSTALRCQATEVRSVPTRRLHVDLSFD